MIRRVPFPTFLMLLLLTLLLPDGSGLAADFPLEVRDARNMEVQIAASPRRVVSLVPAISEMMTDFGRSELLAGVTREDINLQPQLRVKTVGSYFHPDTELIAQLNPDLIIAAPEQTAVIERFGQQPGRLLVLQARQLEDSFDQMQLIGHLFQCQSASEGTIRRNREQLELVRRRLQVLTPDEHKRVVRVVAADGIRAPGDDSFQNQLITAAGGVAPQWGQDGSFVPLSLEQWQQFDAQLVYGCNDNAEAVRSELDQDGWRDVTALRSGALAMFPCQLTCQLSTHIGDFVQWLAAVLYPPTMADPGLAVEADQLLEDQPLQLDYAYVKQARVVTHRVNDSVYRSLDVRFREPQRILSTFEGERTQVHGVGNTYTPMAASLGHMAYGTDKAKTAIARNLGYAEQNFATMMTGADMRNLAQRTEVYQDLKVTALATAGVRGNAMRMSRDSGLYFSHGTINIMVMTNRKLSGNAMARAIITATEAKSAALLDLDIRSSYTGLDHRATGTGTDNVTIVQGEGPVAGYSGGHTKLGELIAKAVHAAVTEAISRQNGLVAERPVVQRLRERHLSLKQIVEAYPPQLHGNTSKDQLTLLLDDPYYASFIEMALAVSDDERKGLLEHLDIFEDTCCLVAARVVGGENIVITDIPETDKLPPILSKAFGALLISTQKENR